MAAMVNQADGWGLPKLLARSVLRKEALISELNANSGDAERQGFSETTHEPRCERCDGAAFKEADKISYKMTCLTSIVLAIAGSEERFPGTASEESGASPTRPFCRR